MERIRLVGRDVELAQEAVVGQHFGQRGRAFGCRDCLFVRFRGDRPAESRIEQVNLAVDQSADEPARPPSEPPVSEATALRLVAAFEPAAARLQDHRVDPCLTQKFAKDPRAVFRAPHADHDHVVERLRNGGFVLARQRNQAVRQVEQGHRSGRAGIVSTHDGGARLLE